MEPIRYRRVYLFSKGQVDAGEEGGFFLVPYDCEETERVLVDSISIRQALARLPPRLAGVVYMHYFLDMDKSEIGVLLGLSRERARQLCAKGLEMMRGLIS